MSNTNQDLVSAAKAQGMVIFVTEDPSLNGLWGQVNTIALLRDGLGTAGVWLKTDEGFSVNWCVLSCSGGGGGPETFSYPSVGGSSANDGRILSDVGGNALIQTPNGAVPGATSSWETAVIQLGTPGTGTQNRVIDYVFNTQPDSSLPLFVLDLTAVGVNMSPGDTLRLRSNFGNLMDLTGYNNDVSAVAGFQESFSYSMMFLDIGANLQDSIDNLIVILNADPNFPNYFTPVRVGNTIEFTPVTTGMSLPDLGRVIFDFQNNVMVTIAGPSTIDWTAVNAGDQVNIDTNGINFLFQPVVTPANVSLLAQRESYLPGIWTALANGTPQAVIVVSDYVSANAAAAAFVASLGADFTALLPLLSTPHASPMVTPSTPVAGTARLTFDQPTYTGTLGNAVSVNNTPATGLPPGSPPLASALTYGILGATAITNTGFTVVTGDLGISPGSAVTGFPPGVVSGTQHINDAPAATAQGDALASYNFLTALVATPIAAILDGQVLGAGVYSEAAGTFNLAASGPGTLTLNGSATDIFVFQCASTLNTGAGGTPTISLTGGALASNVYWTCGSSATINTSGTGTFEGTVIATASVTVNGGSANSRLFALNAAVTISAALALSVPPGGGMNQPSFGSYLNTPGAAGTTGTLFHVVVINYNGGLLADVTLECGVDWAPQATLILEAAAIAAALQAYYLANLVPLFTTSTGSVLTTNTTQQRALQSVTQSPNTHYTAQNGVQGTAGQPAMLYDIGLGVQISWAGNVAQISAEFVQNVILATVMVNDEQAELRANGEVGSVVVGPPNLDGYSPQNSLVGRIVRGGPAGSVRPLRFFPSTDAYSVRNPIIITNTP